MEKISAYWQIGLIVIFSFILASNRNGFINFIKYKSYKNIINILPIIITFIWICLIIFYNLSETIFNAISIYRLKFLESYPVQVLGFVICFLALIILRLAYQKLGNNLAIGADLINGAKLVTDGIYKISRNSIYIAFFLMYLGFFLLNPNLIFLLLFLLIFLALHFLIILEEKILKERFGREYIEYKKRVRRYF